VIRSEFVDISSRFAAGGTRGTVVDLLKFVRGLDRDPLLAPATMDQMFTSMETRDGRYTDYGWGWVVRPVNGRFRAMHTGGQAETRTYLAYFPSIHFAVAAAVNFEAQAGDHLHYIERLYQILMHEPMGVDVYVADRYEGVLYEGARVAFEYGLAHYDRYSAPFTGDAARLEAAFDWFNAVTDRREVEADPKGSLEAMEMGRHPVGNQNMVAIGSHMAAVLEQANGTDYLAAVHGEGAVTFFADYIAHYKNDRSFPRKFRFTQAFEKSVMELEADWESTWNDFTSAVAINRSTDLMRLTQRLKSEFGKAGVYPDFQGDLQRLMMVGIRGEDLAMAISAATSAVDLYPLSDRPYVMAGICQYLLGDFDRGRSSVERAYAIDPAGAAGASSLNGYAHAMRGRGHSSAGFEVLKLAIELHPDVANLYNSAGEFCLLLGDREQAVAYYEKALEVDPEFEKARKMLDKIGEESQ
jgi:tetratricopeptide (TPR) repeat protein